VNKLFTESISGLSPLYCGLLFYSKVNYLNVLRCIPNKEYSYTDRRKLNDG
jgi:hypothetical protein